MSFAILSKTAFCALLGALSTDEPKKTAVGEPITKVRVGEAVDFIDGVTAKRATLDLVGAATTPIGIDLKAVDAPLKAQLKLDGGAIVARVAPESDAAKAGINVYDVVVRLEGKPVPDVAWLQKSLENPTLGKKVEDGQVELYVTKLDLVREARPYSVELRRVPTPQVALTTEALIDFTVADRKPMNKITLDAAASENAKGTYKLGVSLSEPDDVLRSQLRLAEGQGLVVTQVVPDSPAAKAGVSKNDVIITFDKSPTIGIAELTARLQKVGDKPTTMVLQRAGEKLSVDVQPKKEDPVQIEVFEKVDASHNVAQVVSDLLIATDQNGKMLAFTAKPDKAWASTTAQFTESIDASSGKTTPSLEAEVRELRRTVDQLQAELARIEKDRVVEKLESTVKRLEAALSKKEAPKPKK